MSNTCGLFPATPTLDCSGQGTCVSGTCVCNPGWSGNGDWAMTTGLDCQVYDPAQKFLYALFMAVHAGVAIWAYPKVKGAYYKFTAMRAAKKKVGQHSSMVQNRALLTLVLHLCLTAPLAVVLGIVEISTTWRVGIDVLPTLVFFVFRSLIYIETFLFQPFMLTTLLGKSGNQKTKDLLVRSDRFSAVIFFFIGFAGVLCIVSLIAQDVWVTLWTYVAYQCIVGLCMIGLFLQAIFLDRSIRQILDASNALKKQEYIVEIRDKMSNFQRGAKKQTGMQSVLSLVMGCVPFLMGMYAYLLPITFMFPALVWVNAVKTQAPTSGGTSAKASNQNDTGGTGDTGMVKKGSKKKMDSSYVSENMHHDEYKDEVDVLWEPDVPQSSSAPGTGSGYDSAPQSSFDESGAPVHPYGKRELGGVVEVSTSPMTKLVAFARSMTPKRGAKSNGGTPSSPGDGSNNKFNFENADEVNQA